MKISEILRTVADGYLWDGDNRLFATPFTKFICLTVNANFGRRQRERTEQFLNSLGMSLHGSAFLPERDDIESWGNHEKYAQQLRYMWCHFAADIADEWGIE